MKEENPKVANYKDLVVWQKAIKLTEAVYAVCSQLPKSEQYALSDQLKRAVISVPSNIAEGRKRLNRQETIQFTGIALGSTAEVETQLILAKMLYGIDTTNEQQGAEEISRMLSGLIRALR